MDNNVDVKLNDQVQGLINTVDQFWDGEVSVQFIGNLQAGFVRHDQAQAVQDGKKLMIQVSDLSAPNYTASHELIHVLMTLRGFPQVFFPLTTGDEKLDEQLQMLGTELFDIVSHFVVVSEQRKHDLINDEIESMYLEGIYKTIKPEPKEGDDQQTLRSLTLLDAMVFYGDKISAYKEKLSQDFPVSYQAAEKLYAVITAKPTNSPFALRRNVVKLFKAFDEQLQAWGLPQLHNTEFTTVSNVLSERQLNLSVRQVFEIFHSELKIANTDNRAYVGFNKNDDQNSFVIEEPDSKTDSAEFFKETYDKTVKELLEELKMPYIIRE
ncbi:IpaB/EvcA family protein [Lentilactobacillus sp. SPB1-3]|uniref:IpaB/EvcA family protein n=1 Tax=Lentilactobacillus terminaliae TaxID=3003483 RepID=A0ACD5DH92_9LACO|nr:IpaB/EvcA family protein [Lentilactobacillus sp. SPB1-3]MCZ0977948.1 IpaB/EvcA family protein [Lentilactobacillus sp. SPB1-3]